jgi:predicted nucleotidyltransferase
MKMKDLQKIRTDLHLLMDYEVVVFGSYASKKADSRSDIDIAVLTQEMDKTRCIEIWTEMLGKVPEGYDLKIFELLPLQIKASLMQNYEVVFGNRLDISEYLYDFRKLWNDSKQRFIENQFSSSREKIKALEMFRHSHRRNI